VLFRSYLGSILSGKAAEREMREGIQVPYEEIYVRANTGITDIEREIREATPEQEPRST
jgi:cation/acetate symporter